MQIWCVRGESMKININGLTREMTAEEIAEFERMKAEMPKPEPSTKERLDALETTTDDMILLMAELIGGN